MEKRNTSALLLLLVFVSLLSIGVISVSGFLKNKSVDELKNGIQSVLGQAVEVVPTVAEKVNLNNIAQQAAQNAGDIVSEKAEEMKKSITTTIEKEIANLTKSQIEAIQIQICRDWGVITLIPTKQP